jgi:hypothetical protein
MGTLAEYGGFLELLSELFEEPPDAAFLAALVCFPKRLRAARLQIAIKHLLEGLLQRLPLDSYHFESMVFHE